MSEYSRPSYKSVKHVPIGEYFIYDKYYLRTGTCFPPEGEGGSYTDLWDVAAGRELRIYHEYDDRCNELVNISGELRSWMDDDEIPQEFLMRNFPQVQIKDSEAQDHGLPKKHKGFAVIQWHTEWYCVRWGPRHFRNIFISDLNPIQGTLYL